MQSFFITVVKFQLESIRYVTRRNGWNRLQEFSETLEPHVSVKL